MKKTTKILGLLICLFVSQVGYAQTTGNKYEIKAFEKNNKVMLKNLKKQYKADIDVEQSEDGVFYIVIKIKSGNSVRYLIADEVGALLYPNMVDAYKAGSGFLFLSQKQGNTFKWGAIDMKGSSLLPIKYTNIRQVKGNEAGFSSGIWHPANEEVFIATAIMDGESIHTFVSSKDNSILCTHKGEMTSENNYFWKIHTKVTQTVSTGESKVDANDGTKPVWSSSAQKQLVSRDCSGLYSLDGKEILPPEYDGFLFDSSTGLIKTMKIDGGIVFYGAKMIKPGFTAFVVPAIFNDVRWNSSINNYECRIHRGDPYVAYDATATYDFSYRDEGEKLYDGGKFQDVITYYEGEGYGKVWGNYFMGLAANEIAKKEVAQMDYVINTLNSSNNYYLPLDYPDKYKFDTGTIMTMYLSAISYFEKYISSTEIPNDDPTKIEARKLRGELVTLKNNFTKKTDDYTTAYGKALTKNAERKAIQVQQQIQQEKAAEAIVDGIFNLLK